MAGGVDELYSNLMELLSDICRFLSNESHYEKLSLPARKQANELVCRSKLQLQEIAKASIDCSEAYMDMERKIDMDQCCSNFKSNSNLVHNLDEDKNIYTTVIEQKVEDPLPVVEESTNPYLNLPAKDLSHDVKYGTLSWKCKILLKFEKIRKIYAGVHNNWLLVYSSEKDAKPVQCFYLKFYKAHAVSKQNKTSPQDFELVGTLGEGRSYYFIAQTHKDMLQWTTQINKYYNCLNKSTLSISEESSSEMYETIRNEVEMSVPEVQPSIKIDRRPPDLPARRNFKLPPLPKMPKIASEDDLKSLSSTYDPVEMDDSSFSSGNEENDYEPFVTRVDESKYRPNFTPNVEINQNFNIVVSAPVVKPKTPIKPKYFSPIRQMF